jgi:hypothetical protein
MEIAKAGNPLIHMLKYSVTMYSTEESLAYKLAPRVAELTLKVFRRSAYAAFGLALQSFFEGDYRKCIH